MRAMEKTIVIPGDLLSEDARKAGDGTYVQDGKVYSSVYGLVSFKNKVRVVPLSGKYIPAAGDMIIGTVTEVTFSNWIVDINSPYEGLLHVSEYPKRIEYEDMGRYLGVGESILTQVIDVDPAMKVELTLNDPKLRVIKSGRVVEISPPKVPRVIGRGGSMITLLKNETNCNIFVGQNGRIWVDGKDRDMEIAIRAIFKIEREAHISGLTDRITEFLLGEKGIKKEPREGIETEEEGVSILEELLDEKERRGDK